MKFRAEEYYRAAVERIRQAKLLHLSGNSYALAMYCRGLAIECMLRAFRWEHDSEFEGRHDLAMWFRASQLLRFNDDLTPRGAHSAAEVRAYGTALRAAMNEISSLWRNALRFASESSLQSFLKRQDRLRRVRGDALRKNSADLLEAAQMVIDRGVALWNLRKKPRGH